MELSFWCFSVFLHLVFPSVTPAIYLEIVPDQSIAVVGQDVTMNCMFEQSYDFKRNEILWEFRAGTKSMTVWSSNQRRDQNQHFRGRTKVEFVSKKASLTLQNIRVSDGGKYRCIILTSNKEQLNSNFVKLKLPAVHLETVPHPSGVIVGQNVTMNCMLEQSFDPKTDDITWELTQQNVTVWSSNPRWAQDQRFLGRTKVETGSEKASLTLQNVRLSDRGKYLCIIIKSSNKDLHSDFVKQIVSAVHLNVGRVGSAVVVGQDVTMNCTFEQSYDSEKDEILWEFTVTPFIVRSSLSLWDPNLHFQGRTEIKFEGENASLTLKNVTPYEYGFYHCIFKSKSKSRKFYSNIVELMIYSVQKRRHRYRPGTAFAVILVPVLVLVLIYVLERSNFCRIWSVKVGHYLQRSCGISAIHTAKGRQITAETSCKTEETCEMTMMNPNTPDTEGIDAQPQARGDGKKTWIILAVISAAVAASLGFALGWLATKLYRSMFT